MHEKGGTGVHWTDEICDARNERVHMCAEPYWYVKTGTPPG